MAFILALLLIGAGGGSLQHGFLEQRHMERAVVGVMRQIAHQPERELMREQKHEEIEEIRQEGLAKAVDVLGRVGCRFWGEQYQSAPTMRSAKCGHEGPILRSEQCRENLENLPANSAEAASC